MPPENQADQSGQSASDSSINAFMGLEEGKQRDVLGKMSPGAKTALLAGIKTRKSGSAASTTSTTPSIAPASNLPPPPEIHDVADQSSVSDNWKNLGRGAALGAAHGLGIPESADWKEVAGGAVANTASGLYEAGKSIAKDPIEGTAHVLHNMASNVEESGGEAWQGLKERDPEKFAHGFASTITQLLSMKEAKKADFPTLGKAGERARLAKTATAINAGADEAGQLRTAMPDIVKQAQSGGIETVGEFKDTVQQASRAIDQEFNQHLAPIANKPYIPAEIARRIRNLITPDMAQTAEGREQIKEINRRAKEFEKPWTINQINAKRMTENDNLNSFYKKDSQGQAAAKLDTDISKAVRDGSADVVYDQMAQNNPQLPSNYWAQLKQKQGAMWGLRDHLTEQIKSLDAAQLQHEGKGPAGRMKVHAYASAHSVPHGYISGVGEALSAGPEKTANKTIKGAFNRSLTSKAARLGAMALPVARLADNPDVRKTPFTPPPPISDDDEGQ